MFCCDIAETPARRWPLGFTVARSPSLVMRFSVWRENKPWFRGVSSITPPPQMPYTVPTGRLSMPRDALGRSILFFSSGFYLFILFTFLPLTLIIHLYMKLHCEIFMTDIWEQLRKTNDLWCQCTKTDRKGLWCSLNSASEQSFMKQMLAFLVYS